MALFACLGLFLQNLKSCEDRRQSETIDTIVFRCELLCSSTEVKSAECVLDASVDTGNKRMWRGGVKGSGFVPLAHYFSTLEQSHVCRVFPFHPAQPDGKHWFIAVLLFTFQ